MLLSMTIQAVVEVYDLYFVNDYISNKGPTKRCTFKIILKLSAVDLLTPIIFRVCVWSCIIS